jgi:hypothetical protein
MDKKYSEKMSRHVDNCNAANLLFFPIVFSTGGAIHPRSLPILNRIAELIAGRLGVCPSWKKEDSCTGSEWHFKLEMHMVFIAMANALKNSARIRSMDATASVAPFDDDDLDDERRLSRNN